MTKNNKLDNKRRNVEWVVVYITHNLTEAHIVSGRLEHEGIPNMVNVQPGASAMGITIGSMGEIKVLVKPEDYERSVLILQQPEADELPQQTDRYIHGLDDDQE